MVVDGCAASIRGTQGTGAGGNTETATFLETRISCLAGQGALEEFRSGPHTLLPSGHAVVGLASLLSYSAGPNRQALSKRVCLELSEVLVTAGPFASGLPNLHLPPGER